jgi:Major Facilitator Superfamily
MAENIEAETVAKHTTLIFIAVTATTATVTYNSMAVVTAIPPMKAEFEMSLTMTQWIMNGYSLASAVLVAAMGRFGDIFGHMRVIVSGMTGFLLGSFTILLAGDTAFAIVGRVLQGIGAAGILSSSLAILNNAVPEDKRAAAIETVVPLGRRHRMRRPADRCRVSREGAADPDRFFPEAALHGRNGRHVSRWYEYGDVHLFLHSVRTVA